ncbi:MAG: hypothetical protein JWO86_6685 [Myxococcaceae bacterium]|nr:hypothetical protein [Myxococcaceae bacterium]MEA2751831.1 hypothetical protein [Myxococcales bacterium]
MHIKAVVFFGLLLVLLHVSVACSGTTKSNPNGTATGITGALECHVNGTGATGGCICRTDGAFVTESGGSPSVSVTSCDNSYRQTDTGGPATCCATAGFPGVGDYCACHVPTKTKCGSDSASSIGCTCTDTDRSFPRTCDVASFPPACCQSKKLDHFCVCGLPCDADSTSVDHCDTSPSVPVCGTGERVVLSCSAMQ